MSYFKHFPKIFYRFGDTADRSIAQNITAYVDILDNVKDAASLYTDYYIADGERPDHVAHKLYDNPELHWTFYFMNDEIRERGWPLSYADVQAKVEKEHPYIVLNTSEDIINKFLTGQTIQGASGTAEVQHRHVNLGQLVVKMVSGSFSNDEQLDSTNNEGVLETLLIGTVEPEYKSARLYTDFDGNIIDIDPYLGPGVNAIEVTHEEHYHQQNESLKQIRVLRQDNVYSVVRAIQDAMGTL